MVVRKLLLFSRLHNVPSFGKCSGYRIYTESFTVQVLPW